MRVLFCRLFPELRSNDGNKHEHNTQVGTETVRHESTYIILFLTRYEESINDDENDDLYISSPFYHLLSFCSANEVTPNCWWRHYDQTIVTFSRE